MKRRGVLIICLISFITLQLFSQESGTIYFKNGKSMKFEKIHGWRTTESRTNYDTWGCYSIDKFKVDYAGTIREIPYSSISYIAINDYTIDGILLHSVSFEVIGKTGAKGNITYGYFEGCGYLYMIRVKVLDEFTGQLNYVNVHLVKNRRLNVSKIVFD